MGVVCLGELLIDFVAMESGVTVGEASGFIKAPGGAPANVAVAVSRLGLKSSFLGQVGDDPFGHYLAGVLRENKVGISGLRFSDKARTALAFVSLAAAGERSFMFYRHPSADMLMVPDDVALDVIDTHEVFHYGSITMIHEPARSALFAALDYAQESSKLISYDPNLRLALWKDEASAREGMLSGLDYANIVKVSEEEVEFLTGSDDISLLWRDQIDMIVVTRGAGGCTAHTREEQVDYPGYVVESVDTTGAGDAFVAGMLLGILEHREKAEGYHAYLDEIMPFANAVGALATTQKGAIPALPTREQVQEFINQ